MSWPHRNAPLDPAADLRPVDDLTPEAAQAVGEAHVRALTKKAQETVSK